MSKERALNDVKSEEVKIKSEEKGKGGRTQLSDPLFFDNGIKPEEQLKKIRRYKAKKIVSELARERKVVKVAIIVIFITLFELVAFGYYQTYIGGVQVDQSVCDINNSLKVDESTTFDQSLDVDVIIVASSNDRLVINDLSTSKNVCIQNVRPSEVVLVNSKIETVIVEELIYDLHLIAEGETKVKTLNSLEGGLFVTDNSTYHSFVSEVNLSSDKQPYYKFEGIFSEINVTSNIKLSLVGDGSRIKALHLDNKGVADDLFINLACQTSMDNVYLDSESRVLGCGDVDMVLVNAPNVIVNVNTNYIAYTRYEYKYMSELYQSSFVDDVEVLRENYTTYLENDKLVSYFGTKAKYMEILDEIISNQE